MQKKKHPSTEEISATCATAIKNCDVILLPNVFTLLKIAYTLPVTSCECERSASTLRQLNTFMRSSMGEQQLSSLALIHTHYERLIDLDQAVELFAALHPRRVELGSMLTG